MTPQVPVTRAMVPTRRAIASVVSIAALVLGILGVVAALATNASASTKTAASAVHQATVSKSTTGGIAQLLANLGKSQGVPVKTTTAPTAPAAPTSAPTSSAPTASAPTSTAPTTTAPAPSTTAPTTPAPTTSTSDDPADPSVSGSKLVWSDEFNGSAGSAADTKNWVAMQGGKWGGGTELECYTNNRNNSALDGNGDLVITARYNPNYKCTDATDNYTSARLTTQNLISTEYGQIRVRAKVPSASGVWPAIWLLGEDNDQIGWPNAGEMDMMEAIGQDRTTVYGTVHGPGSNGNWQDGSGYTVSSPIDTNFHIYGLDWSPTKLVLSVDGHAYKTITKSSVLAAGNSWVFDRPFFMLLNVAVGGDWPGSPKDNSVFPSQSSMTIDYVRFYQ